MRKAASKLEQKKRMEKRIERRGRNILSKKVKEQDANVENEGAVTEGENPHHEESRPLQPITFDLTSASGDKKTYIIGDPKGIVASEHGITGNDADASSGTSPSNFNSMLDTDPVSVGGINYEVTSSTSQFAEDFLFLSAEVDGGYKAVPIEWEASKRNDQYDKKIQTKRFKKPFPLDTRHALKIDVQDGEDAYVTLFFESYVSS